MLFSFEWSLGGKGKVFRGRAFLLFKFQEEEDDAIVLLTELWSIAQS